MLVASAVSPGSWASLPGGNWGRHATPARRQCLTLAAATRPVDRLEAVDRLDRTVKKDLARGYLYRFAPWRSAGCE